MANNTTKDAPSILQWLDTFEPYTTQPDSPMLAGGWKHLSSSPQYEAPLTQFCPVEELPIQRLETLLEQEAFVTGGPGNPERLIESLAWLAERLAHYQEEPTGYRVAFEGHDTVHLNAPTMEALLLFILKLRGQDAHEQDITQEADGTTTVRLWWD